MQRVLLCQFFMSEKVFWARPIIIIIIIIIIIMQIIIKFASSLDVGERERVSQAGGWRNME